MAKRKYDYWLEEKNLLKIQEKVLEGYTNEDIAKYMNINVSTLYEWTKTYPEIAEALKTTKEFVDIDVENSLFRKAMGHRYKIKKFIKCKEVKYSEETGKKISEIETPKEVEEEVFVPPDTLAIIFYLKNRKPKDWRDQKEIDFGNGEENIPTESFADKFTKKMDEITHTMKEMAEKQNEKENTTQ